MSVGKEIIISMVVLLLLPSHIVLAENLPDIFLIDTDVVEGNAVFRTADGSLSLRSPGDQLPNFPAVLTQVMSTKVVIELNKATVFGNGVSTAWVLKSTGQGPSDIRVFEDFHKSDDALKIAK